MSKTCPNCGVDSPDNSKFCIECGSDISDVTAKKTEVKNNDSTDNKDTVLGCVIMIGIAVFIIAIGLLIFGGGGDDNTVQENISVVFSEVKVWDGVSSGKTYYYYYVNGYIYNIPDDADSYIVKTLYFDASDNEVISTTEKLSSFKSYEGKDYDAIISTYTTPNYIDVDHVKVQIIKDGSVLNEFSEKMNTNKLSYSGNESD